MKKHKPLLTIAGPIPMDTMKPQIIQGENFRDHQDTQNACLKADKIELTDHIITKVEDEEFITLLANENANEQETNRMKHPQPTKPDEPVDEVNQETNGHQKPPSKKAKRFQCELCSYWTNHKHNLKSHMICHHSRDYAFKEEIQRKKN